MPESALQAQVEGGAAEGRQEAEILSGLQTKVRHAKAMEPRQTDLRPFL